MTEPADAEVEERRTAFFTAEVVYDVGRHPPFTFTIHTPFDVDLLRTYVPVMLRHLEQRVHDVVSEAWRQIEQQGLDESQQIAQLPRINTLAQNELEIAVNQHATQVMWLAAHAASGVWGGRALYDIH